MQDFARVNLLAEFGYLPGQIEDVHDQAKVFLAMCRIARSSYPLSTVSPIATLDRKRSD